jgi:choline dehydrogenase-like flavoprotein
MSETFDVIVIGSGAGGSAAAHRLVEGGLRVLLLEKGEPLPRDGSTLDIGRVVQRGEFLAREPWMDGSARRIVPEEHFNVGGKTKWYGAALLRFGAHEFRAESAHGHRAWPFPYETLQGYYEVAERLLGVRRFRPEPGLAGILTRLARRAPRWRAEAMPMALDPRIVNDAHEARHFDGFASVANLKHDAQLALLDPLVDMPNFSLRSGVEAAALLADALDPARITGVRTQDGRIFRAPRVILAAGALHSPRLLARFVRSQGLAERLPGAAHIGANLKLHLLTAMVSLGLERQADLIRKTAFLTHEDFPHSSVQPLGFDAELIATLMPRIVPAPVARTLAERAYGFFLQTEDPSLASNRIDEIHVDGVPRRLMDYDETRAPGALAEHRGFTRAFARALLATGRLSFTKRIGIQGTAHACGTLVCGNDPAGSVVDARGRVHGIAGLYVADGSVLPRVSRVNPSLTIYAWGLRVGDLIAEAARRTGAAASLASQETS